MINNSTEETLRTIITDDGETIYVFGETTVEIFSIEQGGFWIPEWITADELCERYPAPIEIMEPPAIAEIAYTIKQARDDIDRTFYTPPIHRGHPVSPRKRRT